MRVVTPVLSRSSVLPTVVRALVGASVRVLVHADDAATRAAGSAERLRSTASLLPRPRRAYDEL